MAGLCFSSSELLSVRVTSIVVCALSILGSLLIILSYVCFKTLRSNVRLVLVNLSIMDFGVGCANLFGIVYDYDTHLVNGSDQLSYNAEQVCLAQAFFAIWCTHASIIWTILLSAYLYLLIAHQRSLYTKYAFLSFFALGYGVPLMSALWLLCTKRLGYSPLDSGGWCTITATDINGKNPNIYVTAVGYDLWIYLSFVLVPMFCLAVHLRIRDKVCHTPCGTKLRVLILQLKVPDEAGLSKHTVKELYQVHYKFLLIPVVFILLRLWTCIVNIILVYYPMHLRCGWLFALILLSVSWHPFVIRDCSILHWHATGFVFTSGPINCYHKSCGLNTCSNHIETTHKESL